MSMNPIPPTAGEKTRYVIEPNRTWFRFDWAELTEHRDLLFLLFRRDQVARYKQTILGPVWYVLQPLATALIFSLVFGRFAGITTEGVPRILFYMGGLLGWNFFAQGLQSTSGTFASNAELFGKVYFPRLVVPLAALLSNAVTLAIHFCVFLLLFAMHDPFSAGAGFGMGLGVLLLPFLVLQTAALSLGCGLWISSLTATYRDLKHGLPFIISSLMFLTPVIYPLSTVPAEFHSLIQLNPMTSIVEGFRFSLLGIGTLQPSALLWSVGITVLILVSGVLVFQRTERTVIDTV